MGHTSASCGVNVSGHTSSLRVPSPQALTFLGSDRFIAWRLRHPALGECRRGPETFFGMLGASGLRPCARTHLKKGLVPHSSGWWDRGQIPLLGVVPLLFLFFISMVSPFVIYRSMSVSFRHLFSSIASLSWKNENFYKPVSMYAIMSLRFPIWYYFECYSKWIKIYFFLHSFLESF